MTGGVRQLQEVTTIRPNVARGTLDRARWFLNRARETGVADREEFQHLFEAAIVFARSVTLHLQKQYAHTPKFDTWYSECQQRLERDPLACFFRDQRNFVLKEGPAQIAKHVSVVMHAIAIGESSVVVKVIRGKPWYRRSPRILIQDALYPIRARLTHWRERRRRRRACTVRAAPPRSSVSETLRFTVAPWDHRPAVNLLREYLDTLDAIVSEAEMRFGAGDPEAA